MLDSVLKDKLGELHRLGYMAGRKDADATHPEMEPSAGQDDGSATIVDEILAANRRPRVGVGVLVLDWPPHKGLQVLLYQRKGVHGDGQWAPIGGWMEHGETWEQTALREIGEEAGLGAEGGRFLTAVTTLFPGDLYCVTGYVVVRQWYPVHPRAVAAGGPVLLEPVKGYDMKFFPVNDLPTPMFPSTRELLTGTDSIELRMDEYAGRKAE